MTEKNLNALAITPLAEPEPVPPAPRAMATTKPLAEELTPVVIGAEIPPEALSLTTMPLFEEHPTPAAMGAEAPPCNVNFELSSSGPFGAY